MWEKKFKNSTKKSQIWNKSHFFKYEKLKKYVCFAKKKEEEKLLYS